MKKLSLNGTWTATGVSPTGETKTIAAQVPGFIHLDLEREGIIPNMFWRDNAELCQWVETWNWTYSREFDVPEDTQLDYSVIEFGGLDTYADITVNGVKVGSAENMHTPYTFKGTDVLHHGKNTIKVEFTPYQQHIVGKRMDYPTAFNNAERNHVRRMQCTFYWDWVNRFVSFGIWRDVTIHFYDKAHIEDVFVWTHDIAQTSASLQIEIDNAYDDEAYLCRESVEIISPTGACVWADDFQVWDRKIHLQADIEQPQLWWPNGYGKQPLYKAIVKLYTPEGEIIDTMERTFGIRTTRIEQIQDKVGSDEYRRSLETRKHTDSKMGDRPGSSFILLVNGVRIFGKGGNWVPADPFPSRITAEKYDELIRLARDGGLNLLRCWGGGIYEPQEFYDACNKYGVMISQDFQLACAHYPEDDEEFMAKMHREVPIVIKQLRNNPSIAWWAGNNENGCAYDWDERRACDRRLAREIFYPYLALYDPSRPFMPASPFKGYGNIDVTTGDSHMSWWWHKDGMYRERIKTVGRFQSEDALAGTPLKYSLLKFMSESDIEANGDDSMFEYHVKDNPHKEAGAPTLFELLGIQSELTMGKFTDSDDRILKYAYVQYEWTRLSIEAVRRAKWYNAGVQFWMYNDCWPAVGWSMVDWYCIPKAAWYAAKRTSKPIIASVIDSDDKSDFEFYVLNDSLENRRGVMTAYVQSFSGERRELFMTEFFSKANENVIVRKVAADKVALEKNETIVCEIKGDFEDDRAYYYATEPKRMEFGKTELLYSVTGDEEGEITIKSSDYARIVIIEGDIVLSDNFFDMMPGEEKTITYRCKNGFKAADAKIYCYNMK